jgi:ATP-dependent DNA helicase Rep
MIGDFQDRIESETPVAIIRDLFRELDFDAWLREQSKDEALARRRSENIEELAQWLERLSRKNEGATLIEVVNRLCLLGMIDREDDSQQDSVTLMTLHSAKGLEFPFVYIAGVEEGLLPHQNSVEADGLEEERRLAYVGITRAQKELTLCYARKRKRGGDMLDCEPSRFIGELPREFLAWRQRSDQTPEERRANGLSYLESMKNMLQRN